MYKFSEETKKKISEALKGNENKLGKKLSEESKKKIGKASKGRSSNEKHYNWKGNDVSNKALHLWVKRYLQKPDLCEFCNINLPIDLANITGVYNREFINWKYLCRSCHMKFDFKNGIRKIKTLTI